MKSCLDLSRKSKQQSHALSHRHPLPRSERAQRSVDFRQHPAVQDRSADRKSAVTCDVASHVLTTCDVAVCARCRRHCTLLDMGASEA
eukprot:3023431-Rhodomonas_salina.11